MTSFEKKKGKDLCNEKPRKLSAKVKNPCKICNETVNIKTGLQCKGACKKWAHFDCLKFSPTQVEDIQCGFIKINCPCPDCDNDTKVKQSQYDKNKEYQFQPYGRYNECNKTFCPGIPQQKSSQKLNNLDSLNQMSKPLPYGVCEGTSYDYIVDIQTRNEVATRTDDEQNDDDNVEQEDEDEDESDVEEIEGKFQTILLAQSSSQLQGVTNEQTTGVPKEICCAGGPCQLRPSSSSTSSDDTSKEKKKKKDKEKKVKEKKSKKEKKEKKEKDKKEKKDKKDKKEKKSKKEKKEKRRKEKKGKIKKSDSSPCCDNPCCNTGRESEGSTESGLSNDSGLSSDTSKSTKSTQAQCSRLKQICPQKGARSPPGLTKSDDNVNIDDRHIINTGPRAPRTCPPTCQGIPPASTYPPNFPSGGLSQTAAAHMTKTIGKCAPCFPGCCNPYRSGPIAFCSTSSTQVLRLSPLNKSKSCCTIDRSNKKEGTNISTNISAHLAKCSKSDTKTWDQQQIDEYNRKMLLLALERMCQTMGQFSVQFRELMNKMPDKMDTKRREEFT